MVAVKGVARATLPLGDLHGWMFGISATHRYLLLLETSRVSACKRPVIIEILPRLYLSGSNPYMPGDCAICGLFEAQPICPLPLATLPCPKSNLYTLAMTLPGQGCLDPHW